MNMPHQAYVAIGANLGDPVTAVRNAIDRLAMLDKAHLTVASSLYRTTPVGLLNQPDFINAVVCLETALDPHQLLTALFALEAEFGRIRKEKNAPRTLDLDLLLFDQLIVQTPQLTLPHPRLHTRAFVLVPLAEIATDLDIPGRGKLSSWLPAVANQVVTRLP